MTDTTEYSKGDIVWRGCSPLPTKWVIVGKLEPRYHCDTRETYIIQRAPSGSFSTCKPAYLYPTEREALDAADGSARSDYDAIRRQKVESARQYAAYLTKRRLIEHRIADLDEEAALEAKADD